MGREVRRVPANWEHPRNERGQYKSLYDEDFETAARAWLDDAIAWDNGTHEDLVKEPELKQKYPFFWQWAVSPPDADYYRPRWTEEEATHYQVYETVSEGTPVSPVFATLDEMVHWLIGQGYSEHAAREFAKSGWAPTMMSVGRVLADNIHAFDLPGRADR